MNKMKLVYLFLIIFLLGNSLSVMSIPDEPDYLYIAKDRVTLSAGEAYGMKIQLNDTYPIENYGFGTNVYIVSFEGNLTLQLAHYPSGTYVDMGRDVKRYQKNVTLNAETYPAAYKREKNVTVPEEEIIFVPIHAFGYNGLEDRDNAWKTFFFNITSSGVGNVTLYFDIIGIHDPTTDIVTSPLPTFLMLVSLVVFAVGRRYLTKYKVCGSSLQFNRG